MTEGEGDYGWSDFQNGALSDLIFLAPSEILFCIKRLSSSNVEK